MQGDKDFKAMFKEIGFRYEKEEKKKNIIVKGTDIPREIKIDGKERGK